MTGSEPHGALNPLTLDDVFYVIHIPCVHPSLIPPPLPLFLSGTRPLRDIDCTGTY